MATLYYNAAVDTAWDTLDNWWYDGAFTNPALALPAGGDDVFIKGDISYPSATVGLNSITVYGGSYSVNLTNTQGNAVFNDGSFNTGQVYGEAIFNNDSYNLGYIVNNATFNDSSYNDGTIDSGVTFNDYSYNGLNSFVAGAIFNDNSYNTGTFVGDATFNDNSYNEYGTVGNATFNDNSYNNGTVAGDATFNAPFTYNNGEIVLDAYFHGNYGNSGTCDSDAYFYDNTYNIGTVIGTIYFYFSVWYFTNSSDDAQWSTLTNWNSRIEGIGFNPHEPPWTTPVTATSSLYMASGNPQPPVLNGLILGENTDGTFFLISGRTDPFITNQVLINSLSIINSIIL